MVEILTCLPIIETICFYLSFEEMSNLRVCKALSTISCQIPIVDPSERLFFLDGISAENIIAYRLIQKHGSRKALFKAIRYQNIPVIQSLIRNGVDVNWTNRDGWSPLLDNIHLENIEMVRLLLMEKVEIDQADYSGLTPLMLAAYNGNYEIVKLLLEKKAKLSIEDMNGRQVLAWSITSCGNNVEISKLLLEQGAEINHLDAHGISPLILAAFDGNVKMTEFLLLSKADPNIADREGSTALDRARKAGYTQIVRLLTNS